MVNIVSRVTERIQAEILNLEKINAGSFGTRCFRIQKSNGCFRIKNFKNLKFS